MCVMFFTLKGMQKWVMLGPNVVILSITFNGSAMRSNPVRTSLLSFRQDWSVKRALLRNVPSAKGCLMDRSVRTGKVGGKGKKLQEAQSR